MLMNGVVLIKQSIWYLELQNIPEIQIYMISTLNLLSVFLNEVIQQGERNGNIIFYKILKMPE